MFVIIETKNSRKVRKVGEVFFINALIADLISRKRPMSKIRYRFKILKPVSGLQRLILASGHIAGGSVSTVARFLF